MIDILRDFGVEIWAWFGVEGNRDALSALIAALTFLGSVLAGTATAMIWLWRRLAGRKSEETSDDDKAESTTYSARGNQFIVTRGTVVINEAAPPPDPETTAQMELLVKTLSAQVAALKEKLSRSTDLEEREDIWKRLSEVEGRLMDPNRELDVELKRKAEVEARLARLSKQVAEKPLSEARAALKAQDYSKADEVFADVEAMADLADTEYADAAYGRGEVAEHDVRWSDAAKHYARAARLNPTTQALLRAGSMFSAMGRFDNAIEYTTQALAQAEREAANGESEDLGVALNNLGDQYRQVGRYADAAPLLRRALEIEKATGGECTRRYATRLSNLALVVEKLGDRGEAEMLLRRAKKVDAVVLGEDSPDYATDLDNLAGVLTRSGRFAEASTLYQKMLAIREEALGPEHPSYAVGLNNYAMLLKYTRNYSEALEAFERAVEVIKKSLTERHPLYARTLNNLGDLYVELGDLEKAERYHTEAVEYGKDSLGPDSKDQALNLNNLGGLYYRANRLEEAEPLLVEADDIFMKTLGPDHPYTQGTQYTLKQLRARLGLAQRAGSDDHAS